MFISRGKGISPSQWPSRLIRRLPCSLTRWRNPREAAIAEAGQTDFHDGFRIFYGLSDEERRLAMALEGAPVEIMPGSA
jgi:hypothetical protein